MAKKPIFELRRMQDVERIVRETSAASTAIHCTGLYHRSEELSDKAKLLGVLHKIGVAPFVASSVDAYKKRIRDSFNLKAMLKSWHIVVACLDMLLAALSALVAVFGWIWSWQISAIALGVFVCTCAIFWLMATYTTPRFEKGRWQLHTLRSYSAEVPATVLELAGCLHAENPDIQFLVDEFATHEVLDPFLIAKLGSVEYYIAVWDEPKFDASQTM